MEMELDGDKGERETLAGILFRTGNVITINYWLPFQFKYI